jgi:tRNA modification GTPase
MSGNAASIVSVLTPPGRGAVAVVAASGAAAFIAVNACFTPANGRAVGEQPAGRIVFGYWSSGEHREEVIIVRGHEEAIEIHCHGGAAAVARVVDAMLDAGCCQEPWTEWSSRDRGDAIAVEAEIALAAATTRRTAAILLDQRNGALRRAIQQIRADIEGVNVDRAHQRLLGLIDSSSLGLHLTRPWQVAIAGPPNVGKSSLMNALVGYQRAIVFDEPGTTRDVLTAETAFDGWPVRLTDAAGIRAADDPLEAEGVARARHQLAHADLVLWVVDATEKSEESVDVAASIRQLIEHAGDEAKAIDPLVVLNKIDLLTDVPLEPLDGFVAVSALTGAGLDALLAATAQRLVPQPPMPGDAVPFADRQVERLKLALAALERGNLSQAAAGLVWT